MNTLRRLPLPEEVHLYQFDLNKEAADVAFMRQSLSVDERDRANRYHFPRDRDRYIVGRGSLRRVLAEYLGIAPAAVRFRYEPNGKPHLADNDSLRFNLSHSGNIALLAVTTGRDIGVDIEQIRPDMPLEAMAREVFSPREQERMLALPTEEQRRDYFFTLWTLKEAFVKGVGEGITYPLQTFTITFSADNSAVLEYEDGHASDWHLEQLPTVGNGFAALAVAGTAPCLRWRFVTSPR